MWGITYLLKIILLDLTILFKQYFNLMENFLKDDIMRNVENKKYVIIRRKNENFYSCK